MLNPQQQEFLKYYLDPNSETFGNAKQSALKANYEESYANVITTENLKWLEVADDSHLVRQAITNLSEFLKGGNENIKWDASKFALTKLAKKFRDKQDLSITANISLKDLFNGSKE